MRFFSKLLKGRKVSESNCAKMFKRMLVVESDAWSHFVSGVAEVGAPREESMLYTTAHRSLSSDDVVGRHCLLLLLFVLGGKIGLLFRSIQR